MCKQRVAGIRQSLKTNLFWLEKSLTAAWAKAFETTKAQTSPLDPSLDSESVVWSLYLSSTPIPGTKKAAAAALQGRWLEWL